LWRIADKTLVRTISEHDATVSALAFSPDSLVIISGDVSGHIFCWSAQSGHHTQLTAVDEAHDLGVNSTDFSPVVVKTAVVSTYTLASSGNDGFLKLWSLKTGERTEVRLEKCVMAHEGGAMCVNFSPKGDILASSGGDKTVKVWSYPTLEGLRTFSGFSRYVTSCSISRTGDILVATSSTQIRVFKLGSTHNSVDTEGDERSNLQLEARCQFNLAKKRTRPELLSKIVPTQNDITSCDMFKNIIAISSKDKDIYLLEINADGVGTPLDHSPLKGHSYFIYDLKFSKAGWCSYLVTECWLLLVAMMTQPMSGGFQLMKLPMTMPMLQLMILLMNLMLQLKMLLNLRGGFISILFSKST